jgi:hypothetical protein
VGSSAGDGFNGKRKRPLGALVRQINRHYHGDAKGDSQNRKADLPGVPGQIPEAG